MTRSRSGQPARGRNSRPATAAMTVVGVFTSLVLAFAASFESSYEDGSASYAAVFLRLGILAVVPALLLWRGHSRRARGFAAGLGGGAAFVVVAMLVLGAWGRFGPYGMSGTDIKNTLGDLTRHSREAFYLGDEVGGFSLAQISEVDGRLLFEYGRCMDSNFMSSCDRPLTVSSQPTENWGQADELGSPCTRSPSLRGVPVATLLGDVTVFTGSSIVAITFLESNRDGYVSDPDRESTFIPELREITQSAPGTTLPPPKAATKAFVEDCGRTPK